MATVQVKQDYAAIAADAAERTCQNLNQAVAAYGEATWVLAGGTVPAVVYRLLAADYADKLDWPQLHIAMGDERLVPLDDADSNWRVANDELLTQVHVTPENLLVPPTDLSAADAAKAYAAMLGVLPAKQPGVPRIDVLWLGMGEDGHTLSLFPNHPAFGATGALVVPVYDSPKPPPERISLSLQALAGTTNCLIMVSGGAKAAVVAQALQNDTSLPVVKAVQAIEAGGGQVIWLLDEASASQVRH